MNLLAKSCFSPGIISMLSNLITSSGSEDISLFEEDWIKEYVDGMGHEIYRTPLSFKFEGKLFSEVARFAYNEFHAIVFGIEIDICGRKIIKLNPEKYIIPQIKETNVHVYVICEDKTAADKISVYEMSTSEILKYSSFRQINKN